MTTRRQWWTSAAIVAAALLAGAGIAAWSGQPAGVLGYAGWAVAVILGRQSDRTWFRRGWHVGFYEARHAEVTGTLPEGVLRQATTGNPAPEPWDVQPTSVHLTARMRGEPP